MARATGRETGRVKAGAARLSAGLLCVALLLAPISCGEAAPPEAEAPEAEEPSNGLPLAPSDGEQVPIADRWEPDGVIGDREYPGELAENEYELFWAADESYFYAAMRAATTGWVALGIEPSAGMKDADMIMGLVRGGNVEVYDLFSTGRFGPHPPDTELGGSNDILEYGGSEQDGSTVVEFKRPLDTSDEYDHALARGERYRILWSYGDSDEPGQKHVRKGQAEISL